MKNIYSVKTLHLLFFVLTMFLTKDLYSQTQTYSQYFVGGATYSTASTQCTSWNTFRSNINLSLPYTKITISSGGASASATGSAAVSIITALKNGTVLGSTPSGGYNWTVGSCGSGIEIGATGSNCSCTNGFVVRPCIGSNSNWGGATGGATCGAGSQTMTVTLEYCSGACCYTPLAAETNPLFSAASGCSNGSVRVGSGAYYNLPISPNTYYNFSFFEGARLKT